jgi:predicted dehydrogenase
MPETLAIKTAVIGAGYLGRFHAQKYAALPEADLVAVVDTDPGRAREVAAETGCLAVTDLAEVLPEIQAASVAAPTVHHHAVALPLLKAGVHVLVEKPLTVTVAEADELIAAAETRNLVLMTGHLERFNPAVQMLQAEVADPLFIEAHRLSPFKGRATDVDVILDLMIHDIDLLLALVSAPIEEIRATGYPVLTGKVDIANVRLAFADGCAANLTASRISGEEMRRFRVFQRGGFIVADCRQRLNQIVSRGPDGKFAHPLVPRTVEHGPSDHLLDEITSFLAAVRGEAPVPVSGQDGRAALAVAIQINAAIRKNMEQVIRRDTAG